MSRRSPSGAATYVYCVGLAESFSTGDSPFASLGVGGRGDVVRTVRYADLVAVVSDSREDRYDINRENLMAHQRVVEEAMTRSDVLPVAFGTVASSDREVQEKLLKRELDQLYRNLEYVRGRVELDLKVLWNRERLFSEIAAERDDICALRDSIARRPPDSTYYERIHLGELTEAAVNLKRDQEGEILLEALEPLAVETRLNRILAETLILNAAFLVEKSRVPAFDASVQGLGEVEAERLIFQYVGPLPPYNFVNLSVSWDD